MPAYGESGVDAIVIMQCAQELCLPHSLKFFGAENAECFE